jgi:hypothetical protein
METIKWRSRTFKRQPLGAQTGYPNAPAIFVYCAGPSQRRLYVGETDCLENDCLVNQDLYQQMIRSGASYMYYLVEPCASTRKRLLEQMIDAWLPPFNENPKRAVPIKVYNGFSRNLPAR